jgi:hypothetical protein
LVSWTIIAGDRSADFEVSKRKKASVHDALSDSRWITDISMENF